MPTLPRSSRLASPVDTSTEPGYDGHVSVPALWGLSTVPAFRDTTEVFDV
jgi:hypothetical protein